MRVLVIEDDEELAQSIGVGLRRAQMSTDIALDGPSGLERALANDYDVILLDRDLPGMHGDDICADLLSVGCRGRVIMLTAAASNEDLVDGLGLGADDYLAKPSRARAGGDRRLADRAGRRTPNAPGPFVSRSHVRGSLERCRSNPSARASPTSGGRHELERSELGSGSASVRG